MHYGRASAVLAQRARVLDVAYARHPERFVRRPPKPLALPAAVWINPPVRNELATCPRTDDLDPTRGQVPPSKRVGSRLSTFNPEVEAMT